MITRCYLEITNVCNLDCVFCPKTDRAKHTLTLDEFDVLTSRLKGEVCFLYFHLMGELSSIRSCRSSCVWRVIRASRPC